MIAGLSAVGRKLVNIVDPHVKVDSGYSVYQECKDKDLFVKDKNGNEFNGWCWPGNSAYADFLNPAAREWFAEQYEFDKYKGKPFFLKNRCADLSGTALSRTSN